MEIPRIDKQNVRERLNDPQLTTRQLKERGFEKVSALKGGWKEWIAAEYPTEPM